MAKCKPLLPIHYFSNLQHAKNGEVDIIEGVHDNEHNQVAFHTADGMYLAAVEFITPVTHVEFGRMSYEPECFFHWNCCGESVLDLYLVMILISVHPDKKWPE